MLRRVIISQLCCLTLIFYTLPTLGQFTEMEEYDIIMPGVKTEHEDAYIRVMFPLMNSDKTSYVTEIIPKPNHSTAHHMILSGCTQRLRLRSPQIENNPFGGCSIMYAWAHKAPGLRLPPGVGFAVGASTRIKSFQLELHYLPQVNHPDFSGLTLRFTRQPQPRVAGVFLMLSNWGLIAPGRKNNTLDISCRVPDDVSITVIAMRTHAHTLGRAIVGYRLSQGEPPAQLLGVGNPQWPQAFYSLRTLDAKFHSIDISSGDIILARCVYDSTNRTTVTQIGSTHNDEMCNLYMLYHTNFDSLLPTEKELCARNELGDLARTVMDEKTVMPASNPPRPELNSASDLLGSSLGALTPNISLPKQLKIDGVQLGQLSAVATVDLGNTHELLLLHRSENTWNDNSFDAKYRYRHIDAFVTSDPVVHLDPVSMKVKQSWGAKHFVLPHGIHVTYDQGTGKPDAVFVTDVALHQVFKFKWGQWDKPAMVWGTQFEPGASPRHFCQPADVAISSSGEIFIADGYCNSRIVKFAANGSYLSDWPTVKNNDPHRTMRVQPRSSLYPTYEDMYNEDRPVIVHSLTTIPPIGNTLEQVCAANRERAEIVCFTTAGHEVARYAGSGLLPTIYAIVYSPKNRVLFAAVDAVGNLEQSYETHGVLLDPIRPQRLEELSKHPELLASLRESGAVIGFFAMSGIAQPHAMTITTDGENMYAVDLASSTLFYFEIGTAGDNSAKSPLAQFFHNTVSTAGYWVTHRMDGAKLAGLVMLFVMLVFIGLFICIRFCWCGRHATQPTIRPTRSSRWSGRPTKAQRVGFRLLNQDGDPADQETEDEDDQEDVILQRSRYNGSVALRVDAERKSPSQLVSEYRNSTQSDPHSMTRSEKLNGDLKSYVA